MRKIRQLTPTIEKPWFCFDGDEQEFFGTEKEAIEASKMAIDYFRDESWGEQVTSVQVGKVTCIAYQTDRENRPDTVDEEGVAGDGSYWVEECEYKCNYKALPLKSQ